MGSSDLRFLESLTPIRIRYAPLESARRNQETGSPLSLRRFCEEFGERKGVKVDFRSDGLPSVVPRDISLCLFRVLQEAIHNAAKHSGVRHFDGRLWTTPDEIHLTVSDCGIGFNLETARKAGGLGINRMQERLKLVKGSLSIDSKPNRGTTIHACVPLILGSDSMREAGRQLS